VSNYLYLENKLDYSFVFSFNYARFYASFIFDIVYLNPVIARVLRLIAEKKEDKL